MSIRMTLPILVSVLAGCSPTGMNPATTSPAPSMAPSSSPSTAPSVMPSASVAMPANATAYTTGSLKVAGTAVDLPPYFMINKSGTSTSGSHSYNNIGLQPAAKVNDWSMSIQYGVDGGSHSVIVTLVQKTGANPQDNQTFGFTMSDAGGGKVSFIPAAATGTYKEHDGMVDISFSGPLPGTPTATKAFEGNFPNLPL